MHILQMNISLYFLFVLMSASPVGVMLLLLLPLLDICMFIFCAFFVCTNSSFFMYTYIGLNSISLFIFFVLLRFFLYFCAPPVLTVVVLLDTCMFTYLCVFLQLCETPSQGLVCLIKQYLTVLYYFCYRYVLYFLFPE